MTFDKLEIDEGRGGAVVEYSITDRDWQRLRRANIDPAMNLYVPNHRGETRYRGETLTRPTGRIYFRNAELRNRRGEVRVELLGQTRHARISGIKVQKQRGASISVGYERPGFGDGRPPHRPGQYGGKGKGKGKGSKLPPEDYTEAIIAACRTQSSLPSQFNECLSRGQNLPGPIAAATITTCRQHSHLHSDLIRCLDLAQTFEVAPAPMMNACKNATHLNSERYACLEAAARARRDISATIDACDAATKFNSELTACIQTTASMKWHAAPAIKACSAATRFHSEFAACLNSAATSKRDISGLIKACSDATRFNSDFMKCLEQTKS